MDEHNLDIINQLPIIDDEYHLKLNFKISLHDIITSCKVNNIKLKSLKDLFTNLDTLGFNSNRGLWLTKPILHRTLYNKIVDCPYIVGYLNEDYLERRNLWSNELMYIHEMNSNELEYIEDIKMLSGMGSVFERDMEALEHLSNDPETNNLSNYIRQVRALEE